MKNYKHYIFLFIFLFLALAYFSFQESISNKISISSCRSTLEHFRNDNDLEEGEAKACEALAIMSYEKNQGVESIEKAGEYFQKAADLSPEIATEYLGNSLHNCVEGAGPVDESRALNCLQAAAAGSAEAQYGIGKLYFNGQVFPQNIQKSKKWLLKAASQGHVSAQFQMMGVNMFFGMPVASDIEAYAWLCVMEKQAEVPGSPGLNIWNSERLKNVSKQKDELYKLADKWFVFKIIMDKKCNKYIKKYYISP